MAGTGFEQAICDRMDYSALDLFPNHAGLAALIAGFGIAGFVLLLDRVAGHGSDTPVVPADDGDHETREGTAVIDEVRESLVTGAVLFALAAVSGLVSAYLFSAVSGDHCLNAYVVLPIPSVLLAISGLLTVTAISVSMASLDHVRPSSFAIRVFSIVAIVLIVARLSIDIGASSAMGSALDDLGLDHLSTLEADAAESAGLPGPHDGLTEAQIEQVAGLTAARLNDHPVPDPTVSLLIGASAVAGVATVLLVEGRCRGRSSARGRSDWHRAWRSVTSIASLGAAVVATVMLSFVEQNDWIVDAPPPVWAFLEVFLVATAALLLVTPYAPPDDPTKEPERLNLVKIGQKLVDLPKTLWRPVAKQPG